MERMELTTICEDLVKSEDLQPKLYCKKCGEDESHHESGGHRFISDRIETYCNVGVQKVAMAFGYPYFKGLLANEIYDQIHRDPRFVEVTPEKASGHAWEGRLVIAAERGRPHGHVAVCYPGGLVYSGKWNKEVPTVANIGQVCGIMGSNYAFGGKNPPEYWLLGDHA